MRIILHVGKGGVGKTTLSLATALGAADAGHRVCVLSTDSAHSLGDALGRPIGPKHVSIAPGVEAREVSALDELASSWVEIQSWLRELLRDEADAMVVDELLVFPGLEELFALRAVCEEEARGETDVCIVDCAPTGSALRMLRFPDALEVFMDQIFDLERRGARLLRPLLGSSSVGRLLPSETFFDAFENLYRDVADVRRLLTDAARTTARLVVNPAQVVVAEARRTFAYLNLYGVTTDAVLINRVLPEAAGQGFFAGWHAKENASLEDIAASFPVPQFKAPLASREIIGVDAIGELARATFGGADPSEVLLDARPLRLRDRTGGAVLEIDLPGIDHAEVDLAATGSELHIRVRDVARRIALPVSLRGQPIEGSRLRRGVLSVYFG